MSDDDVFRKHCQPFKIVSINNLPALSVSYPYNENNEERIQQMTELLNVTSAS